MLNRLEELRELIIVNSEIQNEIGEILDEYEALVELQALQNIVGIKVGPVE